MFELFDDIVKHAEEAGDGFWSYTFTDDGAADFLNNHSVAGLTFTVEDLREDLDDVTLQNMIVALPEGMETVEALTITEG